MLNNFLNRRNIRDYLNLFPENTWNSVIINTLDIGIESLKQNHNILTLTLDDLKAILKDFKSPGFSKEEYLNYIKNGSESENKSRNFYFQVKNKDIKRKPSSEWRTGCSSSKSKIDMQSNNYSSNDIVYQNKSFDDLSAYNNPISNKDNIFYGNQNNLKNKPLFDYSDNNNIVTFDNPIDVHNKNNIFNPQKADSIYNIGSNQYGKEPSIFSQTQENRYKRPGANPHHPLIHHSHPYQTEQLQNQHLLTQNPSEFNNKSHILINPNQKQRNKTPDPQIQRYNTNINNVLNNRNQRNNRFTTSIGMINSIYPDWWCNGKNLEGEEDNIDKDNDNDEDNDDSRGRGVSMTKIKNKHFTEKLSLNERKAIIDRSRRDNTSGGSSGFGLGGVGGSYGGYYSRDRAASNINTRDRIYDRVQRIEVSNKYYFDYYK